MSALRSILGQKFGRLTVLARAGSSRHKKAMWAVRCDCGEEKTVIGSNLLNGTTTSCGCVVDELRRRVKHGHTRRATGMPSEYRIWAGMKDRCYRPKNRAFANYGGRGIVVCARWLSSFPAFLEDMGPRPSPQHSIERKDNNGDYSPSNCRWAVWTEQCRNTRRNVVLTRGSESHVLADWATITGLHIMTIHSRIKAGWSVEDALSRQPPERARRRR